MKRLQTKFKNTPTNTSLVGSSVNLSLNKEQNSRNSVKSLSEKDKVLICNDFEESQLPLKQEEQNLRVSAVYVLNQRGEPLMPTTSRKARILLKERKAKVVTLKPFTIKLTKAGGETKQEITLGVDTGYKYVGLSCVTENKEVFAAEVEIRTDIVELLSEKRMYRKQKRGKHHEYREARFNNRGIKKGWLAPSVQHKLDSHVKLVDKIHKFLPVTKINVEVAKFDIQKIKNPEISGKEYQSGEQLGYENIRQYVLDRDDHIYQHCKGKSKEKRLQVHHIESRITGGNRPDNLITLCLDCHKKHHEGKIELSKKKSNGFKAETIMLIIRSRIIDKLKEKYNDVNATFGYITNFNRENLWLEKSHINDAFVIANGENQVRSDKLKIIGRRRNNRCLQINRKGYKPSIRKKKYSYKPHDIVIINNIKYTVKGVHSYGKRIFIRDIFGKVISIGIKLIERVNYVSGWQFCNF